MNLLVLYSLVILDLAALVTHTALRGRITALGVALAFSAWMLTRLVRHADNHNP